MSEENVEVVRRILEVWRGEGPPKGDRFRRDLLSSGLLDAEIEWVNPPDAVEPGVRRGIEAFARAAQAVTDTFDGVRLEVDEIILDAGERVVLLATMHVRGRGSSAEVAIQLGHIWTIREGKAVRFEWFNDADQALEAAGLSE
jgi:ketosteroid isomerase-like protein